MINKTSLPKITKRQLDILLYLYKFRYLNINQLQKLLKHKNPRTIQEWIKNLKEKGYINYYKSSSVTKPAICSLTKLARTKLKGNPKCEIEELNRIYQEDGLSKAFINNHLFIADIYLNLILQTKGKEKLHFSTQANLRNFDYMPSSIDAFISIKNSKNVKRYFLILVDGRKPWFVQDKNIKELIEYVDNNEWAKVSSDPSPSFLIICPNAKRKKHFHKLISDALTNSKFYLSTREAIKLSGFNGNAWEKIE